VILQESIRPIRWVECTLCWFWGPAFKIAPEENYGYEGKSKSIDSNVFEYVKATYGPV